MRKLTLLLILLLTSSLSLLIPVGCDKLTTETNNNTYYDSTLGQDCLRCHSDADNKIAQPQGQWATSAHASPALIETKATYNGHSYQTNVCGPQCHTSEGFIKYAAAGTTQTQQDPTVITCFTCHMPHTGNYGSWKVDTLRGLTSPVTLNGTNITYDAGKSNQCVICHQAAAIPNIPSTLLSVKLDSLGVDGPHYSAQAHNLIGQGGFRFGTTAVTNSHATLMTAGQGGCLACHFGSGQGYSYGEHTFRLQSTDGGEQYMGNCTACHTDMTDHKVAGANFNKPAYIHAALDTLAGILIAGHVLTGTDRDSTDFFGDSTVASDAARILFNYLLVKKDGSGGVHNAKYDSTLLYESIRQWDSIPHAAFGVSADTGCLPFAVNFADSSTGRITKRLWKFSDEDSLVDVASPSFTFNLAGAYNVKLTISNEGGASTASKALIVEDSVTPTLVMPGDTVAAGTEVYFKVTHPFGGTTTWDWGDGNEPVILPAAPVPLDSVSHIYITATPQWYHVTVTRTTSCTSHSVTDSLYVTVPALLGSRKYSGNR